MTYYTILVTDSDGTYIFEDDEERLILFINKENAEKEACIIYTNYYLVQVVPYKLDYSENIQHVVKDL